jgi:SAM-dependent methyltransferase
MNGMTSTATDEQRISGKLGTRQTDRSQIKSRDRVRDLAEVYTHEREVNAMLDLVPEMFESLDTTFLEPACGHGNFLVEILARKLALIDNVPENRSEHWFEVAVLRGAASIYGVDISEENVAEAHERMVGVAVAEFKRRRRIPASNFFAALETVLRSNVVFGDTLNAASEIQFFDWELVDDERFVRTPFHLEEPERDLFYVPPQPLDPISYSALGNGSDQ